MWIGRLRASHEFEKYFVLKFILHEKAHSAVERSMFLDEARLAARVTHPNVAQVFDLGESNGLLYLVMERVEGESLSRLVRAVGGAAPGNDPLPLAVSLRVLADICDGLHAAHEARGSDGNHLGLVHRDISPQNIMVSLSGHAKLIDFGLAKAKVRVSADASQPTLKGKLHYISPEQARAEPDVDRRTDIWSVGVLLFRLVTGNLPIDGETEAVALGRLISMREPPQLPAGSPAVLNEIISRTLAPARGERYSTALELKQALELALAELAPGSSHEAIASFFGPALVDVALAQSQALATAEAAMVGRDHAGELAGAGPAALPAAALPVGRGNHESTARLRLLAIAVLAASGAIAALLAWFSAGAPSNSGREPSAPSLPSASEKRSLALPAIAQSSAVAVPQSSQLLPPAVPLTRDASGKPAAAPRTKKPTHSMNPNPGSPRALDNPYKSP